MVENIACSKRGKVDTANRTFKNEWTNHYMFIVPARLLNFLICSETVALIKSGIVKGHNETKHRSLEEVNPQMSEVRASKITELCALFICFH